MLCGFCAFHKQKAAEKLEKYFVNLLMLVGLDTWWAGFKLSDVVCTVHQRGRGFIPVLWRYICTNNARHVPRTTHHAPSNVQYIHLVVVVNTLRSSLRVPRSHFFLFYVQCTAVDDSEITKSCMHCRHTSIKGGLFI